MNKFYRSLLVFSVFVSLTFNVWEAIRWYRQRQEDTKSIQLRGEDLIVKVAVAKYEPIAKTQTYAGVLKAQKSIQITSEIPGKIARIHFEEGQYVEEGQLLIQLDDRAAMTQLAAAKAHLTSAKLAYEAQERLLKNNHTPKLQYDKTKAEWEEAEAGVQKAELDLSKTRIIAPFAGTVGMVSGLAPGSHVEPNQEITRLVSSTMNVEFSVPESDSVFIHKGDKVDVTVSKIDPLPIEGMISVIAPYGNRGTHDISVKATVPNEENKLKEGAFAQVVLYLSSAENALTVPQDAIDKDGEVEFVYVVLDGRALRRNVLTGMRAKGMVQVIDGLSAGDVVITDPVDLVNHNLPVRVDTSS